jgi:hypothetical protein
MRELYDTYADKYSAGLKSGMEEHDGDALAIEMQVAQNRLVEDAISHYGPSFTKFSQECALKTFRPKDDF